MSMVAHGFLRIFPSLEAIQRRTGAMKSETNPRLKEIREKIKSVASVLSVIHFEQWYKTSMDKNKGKTDNDNFFY